jgi:hypothetical protein
MMALVALHHSSVENAFFRLARLLIAIVAHDDAIPVETKTGQGIVSPTLSALEDERAMHAM